MSVIQFRKAGNPPSPVLISYIKALRALIAGNEAQTGVFLNAARNGLGKYWTDLTDSDFARIAPGLTEKTFCALYGDYGSKCGSLWIKNDDIIIMIGKHLQEYGDANDVTKFEIFKQKFFDEKNKVRAQNIRSHSVV